VISQQLPKTADGKGRIAAYEILVATGAVRSLIREQKTFQIASAMSTGRREGMQTIDQHLIELVTKGKIAVSEALKFAENPALLATKLGAQAAAAEAA
jgi:twitching motility protein PilT